MSRNLVVKGSRVVRRSIAVLVSVIGLALIAGPSADTVTAVDHAGQKDKPGRQPGKRDKGSVWVVNRDLGELAIFDAGTGEVIKTIKVGAGAHDICISEQAHKAYIAAETINTVTTVDTRTLAVDYIPVAPLPHHVEPSQDGRTVYVSLASHSPAIGAPEYAAIDTAHNTVTYTTTSANPNARAHGLHPSLNGKTVYVSHDTGDELTGVAARTGDIDFSISPIVRAEEAIATRSARRLWVSSRGDGTVKRVDLRTNTITASVPVGVQPESVMLTPGEHTLIVSLRGSPASLAFVDTRRATLRSTVPIAGTGTFGDLAVITDDGRFVYATFDRNTTGTGGVAVVDVREGKVVDTWAYPGTGRPHGVWYIEACADRLTRGRLAC